MKKLKFLINKYLPDCLILLGVIFFSYNILRPAKYVCKYPSCNIFDTPSQGYMNYHTDLKVLGIFIFTLGIIMFIRRYLSNKFQ